MSNITQLTTAIKDCYEANIPLLILGGPGTAKTDLVEQVAQSMGKKCEYFNSAVLDPSSFGVTIPRIDNSACDILPTAQFIDVEPGSFMFFDEMDKLDTLIQNTMLPMFQNNRLHSRRLSPRWYVMAANRMSDGKGTYDISSILRNRVVTFEFDGPTKQEWIDYAVKNSYDYRLVAAIDGEHVPLNAYKATEKASPTPRQWSNVNKIINSSIRSILMTGLVGAPATAKFEVFINLTMKLPTYKALIQSNGQFRVPDDFALQSILASMIGQFIDGSDAEILKPVLDQLPLEFLMVIFRRAMDRKAKGFDVFLVKHNYINVMHQALKA